MPPFPFLPPSNRGLAVAVPPRNAPLTILGTYIYTYIFKSHLSLLSHPMTTTRRNLSCIGCSSPRPTSNASQNSTLHIPANSVNTRPVAPCSPRFTAVAQTTYYSSGPTPPLSHLHNPINAGGSISYPSQSPTSSPSTSQTNHAPIGLPHQSNAAVNKFGHPLLTPSGRAFAVGGKVQNISSDPLNPCILYWPDNEPFPEQGQIRPSGLVGVPVSLAFPFHFTLSPSFGLRALVELFSFNLPVVVLAAEHRMGHQPHGYQLHHAYLSYFFSLIATSHSKHRKSGAHFTCTSGKLFSSLLMWKLKLTEISETLSFFSNLVIGFVKSVTISIGGGEKFVRHVCPVSSVSPFPF